MKKNLPIKTAIAKFKMKLLVLNDKIKEKKGITTIEMILVLVVIIALILIFKDQLINLVNTIFEKITSESSGI